MAKFVAHLDLNGLELRNAVVQTLIAAPSNPKEGQIYFNVAEEGKHYLAQFRDGQWHKYYTSADVDLLFDGYASREVTFTNKTFDANADGNNLSNVELEDMADGVVQTTVRGIETASDTSVATEKAVRAAINNADTRVDNLTIEKVGTGDSSYVRLKEGNNELDGILLKHFNDGSLQLGENEAKVDAQLTSKAYVDESIVAERSAEATLKNHTIDADNNTLSNIELDNFKNGVVVNSTTGIAEPDSASDLKVATEKAISTLVDTTKSSLTLTGVAPITVDYTAKTVSVADATTVSTGVVQLATAAELASGTDETHALTPKITKAYIDERLTNAVLYRGVWNCDGANDYSALNSFRPMKKGDFFAVNGNCTIDEVEYKTGDHIIFNKICGADETIVTSMIDKIDSTEADDIVRLDATQTLKNKTINSDNNLITNLVATDFKEGRVQVGSDEASVSDDTVLAAKSYVDAQIASGETHADEVTIHAEKIDDETWQTFSVKDNGLTVAKFNTGAVSTAINLETAGVDTKVTTEKAVRDAIIAEESREATLTNKTINAGNNKIVGLEVENFKEDAIVETVRDANAADDESLPTEKAVRTAVDQAVEDITSAFALVKEFLIPTSTASAGVVTWTISNTGLQKSSTAALYDANDEICFGDVTVTDNGAEVIIYTDEETLPANSFRLVLTGKVLPSN